MAHDHHNHADAHHGSTKQYVVGFLLSIVLTIIPFWVVMDGSFGKTIAVTVIGVTAVAQVLVQLVFFLHMDLSEAQRWTLISFVYTILTVLLLVIGSIWIMLHLHHNMML